MAQHVAPEAALHSPAREPIQLAAPMKVAAVRQAALRWRILRAHQQASQRRDKLAHWLDGIDAATLSRNGFIVKRSVLPGALFDELRAQLLARPPLPAQTRDGDTLTRSARVGGALRQKLPALAELLDGRLWNGLTRYVAAQGRPPRAELHSLLTHAGTGPRDPQTLLHSDDWRPTMKAWYFLDDVADDEAPLCYVPGSHRLTPARLAWELKQLAWKAPANPPSADNPAPPAPRRIDKFELADMGLGHPARLVVPANTLIVADTFGFHKRARARRPTTRLELWSASDLDHGSY